MFSVRVEKFTDVKNEYDREPLLAFTVPVLTVPLTTSRSPSKVNGPDELSELLVLSTRLLLRIEVVSVTLEALLTVPICAIATLIACAPDAPV